MIEYIDILNFGSFQKFFWSDSIRDNDGNVVKFKKLNILYGRNYSGKTTLSRILRSLQTGDIPEKYDAPSFSVVTDSGTVVHTQIPTAAGCPAYAGTMGDQAAKSVRGDGCGFLFQAMGRLGRGWYKTLEKSQRAKTSRKAMRHDPG